MALPISLKSVLSFLLSFHGLIDSTVRPSLRTTRIPSRSALFAGEFLGSSSAAITIGRVFAIWARCSNFFSFAIEPSAAHVSHPVANTTLAACAAGLTAMAYAYMRSKIWDVSFTVNGFLAGLVAITCPCYWVTPTGSIALGAIAGVIVVIGVEVLEYLRIDDPIGAVPVHGLCGIWGTISLGLFAEIGRAHV